MLTNCRIACRVLPDTPSGRPRVRYLTGWRITSGPTWTATRADDAVLTLTPREARACLDELRRDGIAAQIETDA